MPRAKNCEADFLIRPIKHSRELRPKPLHRRTPVVPWTAGEDDPIPFRHGSSLLSLSQAASSPLRRPPSLPRPSEAIGSCPVVPSVGQSPGTPRAGDNSSTLLPGPSHRSPGGGRTPPGPGRWRLRIYVNWRSGRSGRMVRKVARRPDRQGHERASRPAQVPPTARGLPPSVVRANFCRSSRGRSKDDAEISAIPFG
jgi:hypothetical protein